MTMTGLNGRVARLEAMRRPGTGHCRSCGLRHVRPLTLAVLRTVLRVDGGSAPSARTEPLCPCDPCCGDAGDRWFARLSHGSRSAC